MVSFLLTTLVIFPIMLPQTEQPLSEKRLEEEEPGMKIILLPLPKKMSSSSYKNAEDQDFSKYSLEDITPRIEFKNKMLQVSILSNLYHPSLIGKKYFLPCNQHISTNPPKQFVSETIHENHTFQSMCFVVVLVSLSIVNLFRKKKTLKEKYMSHSKDFLEELGIDIVYASTPNDSDYGTFESEWNGDLDKFDV